MQRHLSSIVASAGAIAALFLLVFANAALAQAAAVQVPTQLFATETFISHAECHNHCKPACPSKSQCKHAARAPDVRLRTGRTKRAAVRVAPSGRITSLDLARSNARPDMITEPYVFLHPGTPFKTVFASTMSMLN
jgi:hypothetical protein